MTWSDGLDLTDRVAVVTGASSGIGRAIAAELAAAGMRVAAIARRGDRLAELAADGAAVTPYEADLRQLEAIPALFDRIAADLGRPWALVNNAGIGRHAPLLSGATDDWREMVELNVLALCVCTREAVARMQADGEGGHVLHVGSMSGHRVPGGGGVYAATKFAVRALTDGLRAELKAAGSAVRVGCLSPGFVETEFAVNFHRDEGRAAETYARFDCLQPVELARLARTMLEAPPHLEMHDVLLRPRAQPN